MSFKKTMLTVAAVSALTAATAVPAMALENEFHGMYRLMGYVTNAETGGTDFNLRDEAKNSFFAEQRARIMYIAKASDDLKLVTHFELDARFGGMANAGKYVGGDAGNLDADRVTLETKNVYLDFNIPATPVNMKVGLQPFSDAYQGVFGAFDATGAIASAKMGAFTPSLGWFRLSDNNFVVGTGDLPGDFTADLIVVDGKMAINKDLNVGVSYYNVQNDETGATATPFTNDYELLHSLGVNASAKFGPAALGAFGLYQFGDYTTVGADRDISAFAAGITAKVAAGPGKVNASALYLSGDEGDGTGDFKSYRQLATNGSVSYFNPSNMWLLIRNGAMINSSTAIGGMDLTKGSHGLIGVFGGYEMAVGKAFGAVNVGWARVDEKRAAEGSTLGTEANFTVGYKMYDNLTASITGAYLFLGDGGEGTPAVTGVGATGADDPYLANIQLSYLF